jgi:prophage DNA circulation protein
MAFDFITTPLQNFGAALGVVDPPGAPGEWKNLTDGSFKGFTFHVALPKALGKSHGMVSGEVTSGRRIQQIKRPGVDGASLRDFGADAEIYTAELIFFGSTYAADFENFKAILNQGTSGTLVLPDHPQAVNAAFLHMSEKVNHSGANSKAVTVAWVQDNQTTGPVANPFIPTVSSLKSGLDSMLGAASGLLQSNPLIKAVRAAETGLSSARSLTNAVFTLDQGVRNRIIQLQANLAGTLALITQSSNTVHQDSVAVSQAISPSPSGAGQSASDRLAQQQALGVDPETGQRIADFSTPDTLSAAADPLARPELPSEVDVNVNRIQSATGTQLTANQLVKALHANRDELVQKGGSQVSDLGRALTDAAIAYQSFIALAVTSKQSFALVPREMSLLEVLFENGMGLDQLNVVHRQNTWITDPILVPAGSVVTL